MICALIRRLITTNGRESLLKPLFISPRPGEKGDRHLKATQSYMLPSSLFSTCCFSLCVHQTAVRVNNHVRRCVFFSIKRMGKRRQGKKNSSALICQHYAFSEMLHFASLSTRPNETTILPYFNKRVMLLHLNKHTGKKTKQSIILI